MQKTYILPGRKVYEYPYTPELFPFFYDKSILARVPRFSRREPDQHAVPVERPSVRVAGEAGGLPVRAGGRRSDVSRRTSRCSATSATEADKRGIWVVQMFYSIILSKPFAEKHGLETQLSEPTPIAADYTRKSIAEFVKQYPNVGLMLCLGEALQGQENQTQWLTEVILPGIKDGMQPAGLRRSRRSSIRTHATDLRRSMPQALKVYKNLYTEAKFNGESLTTWEPRGVRQQVHLAMSRLGTTHLINVHILANLEPFRYGAQRFIQKSRAGRRATGWRQGAAPVPAVLLGLARSRRTRPTRR